MQVNDGIRENDVRARDWPNPRIRENVNPGGDAIQIGPKAGVVGAGPKSRLSLFV